MKLFLNLHEGCRERLTYFGPEIGVAPRGFAGMCDTCKAKAEQMMRILTMTTDGGRPRPRAYVVVCDRERGCDE